MIRRLVIVVLTFLATTTALLWVVTGYLPVYYTHQKRDELWVGRSGITAFSLPEELVVSDGWHSAATSRGVIPVVLIPEIYFSGGRAIGFGIPFWTLILLFAAYPAIAFIRGPLRRWRRRKRGECVACGYNLTGNVTGVCSECGVAVR